MTATRPEDALLFRLPGFQRKLKRARDVVAEALAVAEQPFVALSGGKDSLVVLALVREQRPDVAANWSDDELEYPEQDGYLQRLRQEWGISLMITLGHARHGGWFDPWRRAPYWRRPHPAALRIDERVESWAPKQGYDLTFLGLRAEEAHGRRMFLRAHGRLARTALGWRCSPLAGWTVADVWAAIAGLGLPYNPVYDRLAAIGVEREMQRVGPLPLTPGWILAAGWPELYRRLVERYGRRWG